MSDPTLPYPEPGGQTYTSGHNPAETSTSRALDEAADGTSSRRADEVAWLVHLEGPHGLTCSEVVARTNLHHGQASGALSNLHKAHRLERLVETRGRGHVYVSPGMAHGRDLAPFRGYERSGASTSRLVEYLRDLESTGVDVVSIDVVLDLLRGDS